MKILFKDLRTRMTRLLQCSKRHPTYCLSMGVIIIAFIVLLNYLWLSFFPLRVMEVYSAKMIKDVYRPGDELVYKLDWCSFASREVTVHARITDGFVRTLPEYDTTIPKRGCYKSDIRTLVLPESTTPGEYFLQVDILIHVNRIREEIVSFETDKFVVLTDE